MSVPVVCTPLRVEQLALGPLRDVEVVRTGMGPARSSRWPPARRPTLVAGVGGALTEEIRPGDVVVATEVGGPRGAVPSPAGPLLAGALRRTGLRVHLGPIASTAGIVSGSTRHALA